MRETLQAREPQSARPRDLKCGCKSLTCQRARAYDLREGIMVISLALAIFPLMMFVAGILDSYLQDQLISYVRKTYPSDEDDILGGAVIPAPRYFRGRRWMNLMKGLGSLNLDWVLKSRDQSLRHQVSVLWLMNLLNAILALMMVGLLIPFSIQSILHAPANTVSWWVLVLGIALIGLVVIGHSLIQVVRFGKIAKYIF